MSFSGTLTSDFMKLVKIPDWKKPTYINFAATDFLTLRNSIIKYIKAVYPLEYDYFVESDLGMMFIELIAYMGAVQSMKADMLANENFFATARQRQSVKKLLELIGVRLKGPLSAAAGAKITFVNAPINDVFKIPASHRTVTVASPADGAPLTFTIYKVVNGFVDTENQGGRGDLFLYSPESDNPAGDPADTVYSNLALQEGTLVTESGEFTATEAIKTIPLNNSPVVDGSVEVFVDAATADSSGAYTEVDNVYFASGSSARIFEMSYDDSFKGTVVFGDGTVGVSPDDTARYFVNYRVGGGSRGNILPNTISTGVTGKTSTAGTVDAPGNIVNNTVATGGSDAETIVNAKRWAPLTFARQDRIVTLEDYAVFTNAYISDYGTVGKATAVTRRGYSSGNVIDIYVLEKASNLQLQKATPSFKRQLLIAINKKKMATDEIVVADGLIRTLDLIMTINIDKEEERNQSQIISQVRGKILEYMNAANRDFGQPLVLSDLNRQVFEIDSVRFSSIDNLSDNVRVDFNEIIQLNNLTVNIKLLD